MARDRRGVLTPPSVHGGLASKRQRIVAALAATVLSVGAAQAQEGRKEQDAATNDALLKKMEQMEQRIRMLENQLRQKDAQKDTSKIARAHGQATPPAAPPPDAKAGKDADSSPPKQAGGAGKPDWTTTGARDLTVTGKTAPVNAPNSLLGLTDPRSPA